MLSLARFDGKRDCSMKQKKQKRYALRLLSSLIFVIPSYYDFAITLTFSVQRCFTILRIYGLEKSLLYSFQFFFNLVSEGSKKQVFETFERYALSFDCARALWSCFSLVVA